MTVIGWIQILLFCLIVVALTPPLGGYMTRVFGGERTLLSPILRPVETAIYKIAGVNESSEQHAVTYTIGMLLFHAGGFVLLYALLRPAALVASGGPCCSRPCRDRRGSAHGIRPVAASAGPYPVPPVGPGCPALTGRSRRKRPPRPGRSRARRPRGSRSRPGPGRPGPPRPRS